MGELADDFAAFLAYRGGGKPSPHTVTAYRQDFAAIERLLAVASNTTVDQLGCDVITKRTMIEAFNDFATSHSTASVRRCWSTWNTFCGYLFTNDSIAANPMAAVLRPPAEKTIPRSFDGEAVGRLVTSLAEPDEGNLRAWQERDFAIVMTFLLTGCRLSELVAMTIGDLRDVDNDDTAKVITLHGKGNKERALTVEDALVGVLTDYLESRLRRFPGSAAPRSSPTDSPWRRLRPEVPLFVGPDNERITAATVQYRVERAYRRAGIDGQRARGALVHQLRHTFATMLADADVSIYTLMRLLGHEAMSTTQRYTEAAGKDTRRASASNPTYGMMAAVRAQAAEDGPPAR